MFGTVQVKDCVYRSGFSGLKAYIGLGSAVSAEATNAGDSARLVLDLMEGSEALFGGKASVISRLRGLASECAELGWDGDDALPVDRKAIEMAYDFIRALPEDITMPDVAPEPDGSISVDWIRSKCRMVSVSIGPGRVISYAWLDGAECGHGTAFFDGANVPERLLEEIRRVGDRGNTSLRAA